MKSQEADLYYKGYIAGYRDGLKAAHSGQSAELRDESVTGLPILAEGGEAECRYSFGAVKDQQASGDLFDSHREAHEQFFAGDRDLGFRKRFIRYGKQILLLREHIRQLYHKGIWSFLPAENCHYTPILLR